MTWGGGVGGGSWEKFAPKAVYGPPLFIFKSGIRALAPSRRDLKPDVAEARRALRGGTGGVA